LSDLEQPAGPTPENAPPHPKRVYDARVLEFTRQAEALSARSNLVSNLRGTCFLGALITGFTALNDEYRALAWACGALLAGFAVLIWWHARVLQQEDAVLRRLQVNRDASRRCGKDFRELDDGAEYKNPLHPYADDLDIFGRASLFQLVNVARTQFGRKRVAAYLMNRAAPDEIANRQAAARELEPQLEVRHQLEAFGLAQVEPLQARPERATKKRPQVDLDPLLAWAEGPSVLLQSKSLMVVATLAPPITLAWMVWCFVHGLHPINYVLPIIAQAILVLSAQRQVSFVFSVVSSHQGAFLRFGPMLRLIEQLKPQSELLTELQGMTRSAQGQPPSEMMRRFENIVSWFELRHNGLIYPFVNVLLLWDFHCVFQLERWQQKSGKQLRGWFHALGEFEAVSSLASFAHDHPSYAWPTVETGAQQFVARGLGHPLIVEGRVVNDVQLVGAGRALLVTGSNMSGKSTLLRAMGLNAVLAQAGAPVCASELSLGPLAVRTSMRISDSLDQGVSHFYAELRKLKAVLDSLNGGVPVFFLLDEILHGTNSEERQVGARWVLGELLRRGALGAVSTHDSGLCELPEPLMGLVQQVHLRETAIGDALTFDYKLREGPVQAGNALKLMRSIGIPVPTP
jgi:MutS domain V